MKPASFEYQRAASVAEALSAMRDPALAAKPIAGGQSLGPMLNLRLARPPRLVDISGVEELRRVEDCGAFVRFGAAVTHARIEDEAGAYGGVAPLARVARGIAYRAVRNRGTIGGSLALADPAAEYPACAVALDAVFILKSKASERRVKAEQFFKGLFETELKPGELLVAAEFPLAKPGDRSVFLELTRRHGDYAIIGLAAYNERHAFLGVGDRPALFSFEKDLEKAKKTLKTSLKPCADLYHSAAAKLHLAGVLLERAWNTP